MMCVQSDPSLGTYLKYVTNFINSSIRIVTDQFAHIKINLIDLSASEYYSLLPVKMMGVKFSVPILPLASLT